MYIITYDFENDKRRTKFSKFLKKFGRRIQYSVFEIRNSKRILHNITTEIETVYEPLFTTADSVFIVSICDACKKRVKRYGYAVNEEDPIVIFE